MKKLFFLFYIVVVCVLAGVYRIFFFGAIDPLTGYYSDRLWPLYLFYGACLLFGLALFFASGAFSGEDEKPARISRVALALSSFVLAVCILGENAEEFYANLKVLPAGDAQKTVSYILGLAHLLITVLAAVALCLLAVRLLRHKEDYKHAKSILFLVLWQSVRLVVRFGQLPMAYRMPHRLLEMLYLVSLCIFLLQGSHLLCRVLREHTYRSALFFGYFSFGLGFIWFVAGVQTYPVDAAFYLNGALLIFTLAFTLFLHRQNLEK